MRKIIQPAICAFFVLPAFSSFAGEGGASTDKSLSVGLVAGTAPRYVGSDEQRFGVAPLLHAEYGGFFLDTLKGMGYGWHADNGFYVENSVGFEPGRSDKNSSWEEGSKKLKGMGKIKSSVNTSVTVGWALQDWLAIEGEATLPLTESNGTHYRTSAILTPFNTQTDNITFEAAALFADSRYLNTWFGVNQQQSVRSGYAKYHTEGGFYASSMNATWTHLFNENWSTALSYDYTLLADRAEKSPIVRSRGGSSASVAVNYTF